VCDHSTSVFLYSTRHPESIFVIVVVIIIIIIIIVILVITFIQGTYNYVPETRHVSRVYSVAVVLYLQFALNVMLFRP
jgi:hypothetical protein